MAKYVRLKPVEALPDDPLAGAWRTCTYMLYDPPDDAAELLSDALGVPVELLQGVIGLPDSMDGLRRFMRHSSLLEPPGDGVTATP